MQKLTIKIVEAENGYIINYSKSIWKTTKAVALTKEELAALVKVITEKSI